MLFFHATNGEQSATLQLTDNAKSSQEFKNNTMDNGSRKPEEFPIRNQQKQ